MTDLTPPLPSGLTIGFLRRGYSRTGGVEAYLKGLASGLLNMGHRPVLFGTPDWPLEDWPGGGVLRCPGEGLSEYATSVKRMLETPEGRCDLTLSVEKIAGCDLYRTDEGVHAAWLDQRERFLTLPARIFQRLNPKHREKLREEARLFSARSTRRVISLSEKISREIVSYYGYPTERITLIRNGVAAAGRASPFLKSEARKRLGIPEGARVALFVGTGWERKGLRYAVDAVASLGDPALILLVAGEGNRSLYAHSSVRFLGPVRDMAPVYAASDLLLFPTLFDPFPLAALEALGAGLPVLTTTANGVSEIMTQGLEGTVLESPDDTASLSRHLREWFAILENPKDAPMVSEACVSLAKAYTLGRNLQETLSVMDQVLAEKRESRGGC